VRASSTDPTPVAFHGEPEIERTMFWEHEDIGRAQGCLEGDLMTRHGSWELYDMDNDRTELTDVSATIRNRGNGQEWDQWSLRARRSALPESANRKRGDSGNGAKPAAR